MDCTGVLGRGRERGQAVKRERERSRESGREGEKEREREKERDGMCVLCKREGMSVHSFLHV